MTHTLPKLPYPMDALEPFISKETLEYHYGKHHQAYVNKLNGLIEGTQEAGDSLEKLIKESKGGIFNNAAQIWNHTFYWQCLTPEKDQDIPKALQSALEDAFESVENFKKIFSDKAATLFGSGWAWLVQNADGSLSIEQTANADCPIRKDQHPLLTCDVWEHAYYIDTRNNRAKYIENFWHIVNWEFVSSRLK